MIVYKGVFIKDKNGGIYKANADYDSSKDVAVECDYMFGSTIRIPFANIKDMNKDIKPLCERFVAIALANGIKSVYTPKEFEKLQKRVERDTRNHGIDAYTPYHVIYGATWVTRENRWGINLVSVAEMNSKWGFEYKCQ